MTNPIVFFDISLGSQELGRVKFELFNDKLPRTCENFRQFCTGEYRENYRPLGYKGTKLHRVIQGGDFINGNGLGSKSIYGSDTFPDEGFFFKHKPMSLSMANSGKDTNGCQFFICCAECPHLDGKHVVFGKVIQGEDIIRKIEHVPTVENNKPAPYEVTITNCGEM